VVSYPLVDINGSVHMEVDGNATITVFSAVPPIGEKWELHRIIGYLEGTTAFSTELFGNLPALSNGVEIRINGILMRTITDNLQLAMEQLMHRSH
jgi:hypothetical protein